MTLFLLFFLLQNRITVERRESIDLHQRGGAAAMQVEN